MGIRSYKEAGVDIRRGDGFASFIGSIESPAVSPGIGGFAGALEVDLSRYSVPVIMSTTDGVGTKLLVAKQIGDYSTIGIDLVAMCVNDLIVCGAEPLQFLDYIACGVIDERVLSAVIQGIVRGCEEAGCVLGGGETAEMPDMYGKDDIDLAGFCTGIAEKGKVLPKKEKMKGGDGIFGMPSRGIHSNGLSLARKAIMPENGAYPELLVPTKIYVSELKKIFSESSILGAAHITGGGLYNNIKRVLPPGLFPRLNWDWSVPEIFAEIQRQGEIEQEEMRGVFNMGIGIALIASAGEEEKLLKTAAANNIQLRRIGRLENG